ncbi:MAG: hypothetical protein ACK5XO_07935 [Phycisphaerales bacterium]
MSKPVDRALTSEEIGRLMTSGTELDTAIRRAIRRAILQYEAYKKIEKIIAREEAAADRVEKLNGSRRRASRTSRTSAKVSVRKKSKVRPKSARTSARTPRQAAQRGRRSA